jgi:pyruvate ferredoxin oxidoreductase alpha subunit
MTAAPEVFDQVAAELRGLTGRRCVQIDPYRLDDAERVVVALGSTAGTIKDVVDELRSDGERVGLLRICSFRPFPHNAVRAALSSARSIVVLDRALSPGANPPLFTEIASTLHGWPGELRGCVYGLGGRDLGPDHVRRILDEIPSETEDGTIAYMGMRKD